MINNLAWNVFKNTGDINTYLELRNIEKLQENIGIDVNENDKSKWDNNFGK